MLQRRRGAQWLHGTHGSLTKRWTRPAVSCMSISHHGTSVNRRSCRSASVSRSLHVARRTEPGKVTARIKASTKQSALQLRFLIAGTSLVPQVAAARCERVIGKNIGNLLSQPVLSANWRHALLWPQCSREAICQALVRGGACPGSVVVRRHTSLRGSYLGAKSS